MSRKKRKEREFKQAYREKFSEERHPPEIKPLTDNQKWYKENLLNKSVNIATGMAGTGKTFMVSAMAADEFRKGNIQKIIVCRPYVQTGKSSGSKPGDTLTKLYPYVRTMLDTIKKRIGKGAYEVALKDGQHGDIEVCEIESIRGRSFDEPSWLIIDEAQQTTQEELISVLTRCSDQCKVTLCGDPCQKDIRGDSGLEWFTSFTKRHDLDVGIVEFTSDDIVRGGLVKDIIKGLEEDNYFVKEGSK